MIIWYVSAAAGVVFIIVALLLADLPYRMQDGTRIDIAAQAVCLPHKQVLFFGGYHRDVCMLGFKRSDDGRHFTLYNYGEIEEKNPDLKKAFGTGQEFHISGVFTYGAAQGYEKYDVVGMIDADNVELLIRQ